MSDLGFVEHPDGSWRIGKKAQRKTLEQLHAGPAFHKYDGRYVKKYYDICWANDPQARVVRWCWPNAGTFHDPSGRVHQGEGLYIRISAEQDWLLNKLK